MTTTISRLYDNYGDARRAVRDLEAAGVQHDDISIIASNAEDWYDRIKATPIQIAIWTAKMTALKPRGLAQALVLLPVVPSVLLPVLASWQSPVWGLSWQPAGWYRLLPALLQVPQLAVSWVADAGRHQRRRR